MDLEEMWRCEDARDAWELRDTERAITIGPIGAVIEELAYASNQVKEIMDYWEPHIAYWESKADCEVCKGETNFVYKVAIENRLKCSHNDDYYRRTTYLSCQQEYVVAREREAQLEDKLVALIMMEGIY